MGKCIAGVLSNKLSCQPAERFLEAGEGGGKVGRRRNWVGGRQPEGKIRRLGGGEDSSSLLPDPMFPSAPERPTRASLVLHQLNSKSKSDEAHY